MNVEAIFSNNTPIVFAADQPPFTGDQHGHRFCVLQPLMTLTGDRIDASPGIFPNRGRVWWMLRDNIRDEVVVPGTVWTGPLESAKQWEPSRPDSDKFQTRIRDIQAGGHDLIEVLTVEADHPDLALVRRGRRLPWPRPTTGHVFIRGRLSVLGPLKTTWHANTQELEFAASSSVNEVLRLPADVFAEIRQEQFHVTLGQYDPKSSVQSIPVCLTRFEWIDLSALRERGDTLDASSDIQVLNWAVKNLNISRKSAQEVKNFFQHITGEEAAADEKAKDKIERLKELAQDADRIMALGEDGAKVLAGTNDYEDLVKAHLDVLCEHRVGVEVEKRRDEINTQLVKEHRQLEAVRNDIAKLSKDFERRASQQDDELRVRMGDKIKEIENEAKKLNEREKYLQEQEHNLQQRLERVIERYATEAEKLGDDLLVQLPIIQRMGIGSAGGNGSHHADEVAELTLPHFLSESAEDDTPTEAIDEPTFIAQFERVVQRRGFQFDVKDLINFHVCSKIGGMTILAGPSGTGKSSLPHLYAEALGHDDRFLPAVVRPDWLDDRDFIGAFNPLAKRFEPAGCGIVDHLIAAGLDWERQRGGIYFVCLDEMNLARVEHYFAQFLSIMERPAGDRFLSLFAPGLSTASDPYTEYREINLYDNLRITGTVNIDETAHFFSPKVLDRSQVISLPVPNLASLEPVEETETVAGITPVSWNTFNSWRCPPEKESDARTLVLEIDAALQTARLSLGARQFFRLMEYVASARAFMDEDTALDYQISQVILPRLRRVSPKFEEAFEALRKLVPAERFPRSAEILTRMAEPGMEYDFFQLL